jgi:sterol desaturase/sphingolipid hydroxylase (fatty acid hydroxylase superfamily)
MKYDLGTILTVVAVLVFYMRLIIIQRQRIKKAQYQYAVVQAKNKKSKKTREKNPEVQYARLGVQIKNWWLVGVSLVLITFGAVIAATHFLGATFSAYWWVPVLIGIGLFTFELK